MPTLKELLAQQEALAKQINETRVRDHADAITKVKALIADNGLTVKDVFGSIRLTKTSGKKKAKTKVAAKYRDQNGNSWTGRGRAPKWIEGKDKSKFLIA